MEQRTGRISSRSNKRMPWIRTCSRSVNSNSLEISRPNLQRCQESQSLHHQTGAFYLSRRQYLIRRDSNSTQMSLRTESNQLSAASTSAISRYRKKCKNWRYSRMTRWQKQIKRNHSSRILKTYLERRRTKFSATCSNSTKQVCTQWSKNFRKTSLKSCLAMGNTLSVISIFRSTFKRRQSSSSCANKFNRGIERDSLSLSIAISRHVNQSWDQGIYWQTCRKCQIVHHRLLVKSSAASATRMMIYMKQSVVILHAFTAGTSGSRLLLNVQLVGIAHVKTRFSQQQRHWHRLKHPKKRSKVQLSLRKQIVRRVKRNQRPRRRR